MFSRLPEDAVLVGVFGFLDEYKGFGTAIRALHHLPKNYHLLIFGGIHPNQIAGHGPVHPYLASLFGEAYADTSLYERLRVSAEPVAPGVVLAADRFLGELLGAHPRDLSTRIHFMGALGDADFLAGMAMCNSVVFPYLEVGQSSSGPISQALELGCRIIASRTHTFLGFAEYHKDAVEFFDIGNHLELAERLLAPQQFPARHGLPEFNVETNKAVYLLANSALRPQRARNGADRAPLAASGQSR
jgi:glycosyltransferase involved in cell wall biosynthesis